MISILAALALQTTPTPVAAPPPAQWTQAELEKVSDEIRHQIEELRGMTFKSPVAVKLTDKKGFLEYALKRQSETESPEKLQRDETIAKLLGLIPASMDYQKTMLALLEEQVGGFYDPATKTFYLMDTFTGGVAKIILAHELTHALDDQHFDIDGTLAKCGGDTDASIAFQAVVEGSGTGLMNQWFLKHSGEVTAADLERAQGLGAGALAAAPPYLWKPLLAVYLMGESFLVRSSGMNLLMKAAKTADVERAFTTTPRSSEQILHSKKYWNDAQRDDPKAIAIDTAKLPKGWTVAGQDTLGELYLAMLTTPRSKRFGLDVKNPMSIMSLEYTNKAAEGWGGDRLVLLARGDDRMLQLVTAWDSAQDADEFAAALSGPKTPGDPESQGVPGQSTTIPTFGGPGREAAQGWIPGSTATDVSVTRESAADGTVSLVVVRVFSFAQPGTSAGEIAQLSLPFSLVVPAK